MEIQIAKTIIALISNLIISPIETIAHYLNNHKFPAKEGFLSILIGIFHGVESRSSFCLLNNDTSFLSSASTCFKCLAQYQFSYKKLSSTNLAPLIFLWCCYGLSTGLLSSNYLPKICYDFYFSFWNSQWESLLADVLEQFERLDQRLDGLC